VLRQVLGLLLRGRRWRGCRGGAGRAGCAVVALDAFGCSISDPSGSAPTHTP